MMTPCEKLGYKVGDKFKVLQSSEGFGKGQTITLFEDDDSASPLFKGDNTLYNHASGAPGAHLKLSKVKPLTATALNKSKTWLAMALIEVGVTKFPEGANWAAQDRDTVVAFYCGKPHRSVDGASWLEHVTTTPAQRTFDICNEGYYLPALNPQWHQTVLSRDEFDQFVAETAVRSEPQPEPTTTPTLDQLLQDWRNADDFAQRKQTEADEAAAMRDERWQAVQVRATEMNVTVGLRDAGAEPEADILSASIHASDEWCELLEGDEVEITSVHEKNNAIYQCVIGSIATVISVGDPKFQMLKVRPLGDSRHIMIDGFRFIRRP